MGRSSFQRPVASRRPRSKVVLACEGRKTEPANFRAVKSYLRDAALNIRILRHDTTDPLRIVEQVVDHVDDLRTQRRWTKGDAAFAILDGDEHWQSEAQRRRWDDAVRLAQRRDIQLAISNPSFELWYLLHFVEQRAPLTAKQAIHALRQHLAAYDKAKGYFRELHIDPTTPLTEVAIARAAALQPDPGAVGLARWPNPSTGVAQVVRLLLDRAT
ncbi:MAG: RloB domain-containing protein [Deltaproteobacteria bacterium]|nr:RloB domain-containing protein [Deltaproteobacteria bacterium]